MMTREICKHCGDVSAVGFSVSDKIWLEVNGSENGVLCLKCFTKKAENLHIAWDKDIKFYPVSLMSHLEVEENLFKLILQNTRFYKDKNGNNIFCVGGFEGKDDKIYNLLRSNCEYFLRYWAEKAVEKIEQADDITKEKINKETT